MYLFEEGTGETKTDPGKTEREKVFSGCSPSWFQMLLAQLNHALKEWQPSEQPQAAVSYAGRR